MAVPCVGSPTGCLGSPASCCSGRRCSTPPMTSGQRRSPEPPPKATRLDTLHPTKNSDHVAEHWSLISGRKSHHSPYTELAEVWGVSKEAARKKVEGLRRPKQMGNDGRARVMVDLRARLRRSDLGSP